jgi:signal transduction histidine kinase/predicted RNA-binding protein with RPS1 domain/DNA-binding response OmpR family regulator
METYQVNQRVEAIVEHIYTFGVFVRLADGTQAYIRRRELDLDADVDPFQVIHEGDKIQAMVMDLGSRDALIELSRRATLEDPWPGFIKRISIGDIIHGEVRALHTRGVFVRIEPGINGFVPLGEIAPKPIEKPEEVLWTGDSVEAEITRIEPGKRHISLSIKARLEKYDQSMQFAEYVSSKLAAENNDIQAYPREEGNEHEEKDPGEYREASPILIIEDDDKVRSSLEEWLSQRNIQVTAVSSKPEVMEIFAIPYRIILVDLNLQDDDGLQLIQQIKQHGNPGYICVMSAPDILADRATEIQAAKVVQVFAKPLDMDEIKIFLSQVSRNEQLPLWQAHTSESKALFAATTIHSPENNTDTQVQSALRALTKMLQAEIGLLFWLDSASHAITVQAQAGEGDFDLDVLYSLRESPVKDVIAGGELIFENHVTSNARAKFDKLWKLVPFESCIGVPIKVFSEIHHALFFFHSGEDAFNKYHLRDAQTGALLLSSLLTDQYIREQVRLLSPMLLSGELSAGFGHDVFNKITALELEASNLVDMGDADKARSRRILDLVLDLKGTVQAFQQLLQKTGEVEIISDQELLERTLRLIRPVARKERVSIALKLAPELSPIVGKVIFFQQVFFNIMLNAIQQMALKAEKFHWNGKRTLEISSIERHNCIQVRFKDNGPGIHKEHLGKLFTPGFSTRGGSGLGLYIAQSFIQAMGGSVTVEETLVPLGTTFLVELPLVKQESKA